MNTIEKRIQAYLSKIPKQKVELSLVEEVKDAVRRGVAIEKELSKNLIGYNGLIRSGNTTLKKLEIFYKMAKDVGYPIPPEIKKLEQMAKDFIKKGEAVKKVANLF